jgi:hypothetical protein
VKTATAVHQNEWQRKLFIRMSGSESCSSERVAAKAVHQNEWQRKLFIRTSGSESCSSERVAAKAVHQNEWQRKLFIMSEKTAWAVQQSSAAAAGSKGCFAADTSTPAIREFNRFSSAPNPLGDLSPKLGSG